MNNMFTVKMGVVASTGTYIGVGMARSIKMARSIALRRMWEALYKGDSAAGYCSGIAVEFGSVTRYGKTVEYMNY